MLTALGMCPSSNSLAVRTSRRMTEESAMRCWKSSTETLRNPGLENWQERSPARMIVANNVFMVAKLRCF